MINFLKYNILFLYNIKPLTRCLWGVMRGRYFVFRNESDEFINFCKYLSYKENDKSGDSSIKEFFSQLNDEIKIRESRNVV